jgi:hypothetical protein
LEKLDEEGDRGVLMVFIGMSGALAQQGVGGQNPKQAKAACPTYEQCQTTGIKQGWIPNDVSRYCSRRRPACEMCNTIFATSCQFAPSLSACPSRDRRTVSSEPRN